MPCIVLKLLRAAFAIAIASATSSCFAQSSNQAAIDAGRELYWHGMTAAGDPVTGVAQGDIQFSGEQFSCVSCHRPSGFGSSEGGHYVPPIAAPVLFTAAKLDRVQRFKEMFQESQPSSFWAQLREPRLRAAYDRENLATALRDGVNPEGQAFNPIMPRYELADTDLDNLTAFLKTLSPEIDPGVEKEIIHLATIVNDGADRDAAKAMLRTIEEFFTWMNKDTAGDLDHPAFSPGYRSEFLNSYRHWELHVWRLSGDPDTWPAQLEKWYNKQPVFAVVSGIVDESWETIGEFCNGERLPCLFPNTELPHTVDADYGYSLYFSGGLTLEGQALALHISKIATTPQRIIHIGGDDAYARTGMQSFSNSIATLLPQASIENHNYSDIAELNAILKTAADDSSREDAIVLWPGKNPGPALQALADAKLDLAFVAWPSNALKPAQSLLTGALAKHSVFVHPYELPSRYHPRKFRVRAWMHSRRLEVTHTRIQYQTYYALTLLQYGLVHLLSDFHRDYLIELIEHEAENKLNPGTHPALALGPGQRFASKGAYVVVLDPEAKGGFKAQSEWLIP